MMDGGGNSEDAGGRMRNVVGEPVIASMLIASGVCPMGRRSGNSLQGHKAEGGPVLLITVQREFGLCSVL